MRPDHIPPTNDNLAPQTPSAAADADLADLAAGSSDQDVRGGDIYIRLNNYSQDLQSHDKLDNTKIQP